MTPLLFEEPIGSMFIGNVPVFSDSVVCAGPGALDLISASRFWEKKAGGVVKSHSLKNRKDAAGLWIDVNWHECLGDVCAHTAKAQRMRVGDQVRT